MEDQQEKKESTSIPQAIERDIQILANEVNREKVNLDKEPLGDRELIRRALHSFERPNSAQSATVTPPDDNHTNSPTSNTDNNRGKTVLTDILPEYAKTASSETKLEIEFLLEEAFREGITKATEDAKKSSPFVLDTFRDSLAGKLHDELKKRKLLDD
jgi:hypothetical protein